MTTEAVFNAICSGFETLPKVCGGGKEDSPTVIIVPADGEGISGRGLIIVVVLLVLVNLLLIVLYKRCSNREMKDDMQLQVNSAVS